MNTPRKARGETQSSSNSHQKHILPTYEHIPIGIVEASPDGEHIYVNEEFCNITGYPKEELLTRGIQDVTHNEDYGLDIKLYHQLVAGEIPFYEIEKRYVRKDGSIVWAEVTRSVVRNSKGKVLNSIGAVLDISERKHAEERLRASEEKYRRLVETANEGIWEIDQDIRTIFVNQRMADMLGYTVEEMMGRSPFEFLLPEDQPEGEQRLARAKQGVSARSAEFRYRRKDGSVVWTMASNTPKVDAQGNFLGSFAMMNDITVRKRAEEEIRQLNDELENRVQRRTAELHESRERLQTLTRRLVEVQDEERRALARELHDRVGQILAALKMNLTIIEEQLSEDSKRRAGSRLDESIHFLGEITTLIRNVMTDLRPAVLEEFGLEAALRSYIDEYIPRYSIKVVMDRTDSVIPRLDPSIEMTFLRIAQEALTNIARHAQADEVILSLKQENNFIYMTIEDNGVGIKSLQESTRPGHHGLTIMRERAEAVGGTFRVSSGPGKGTKIEVTISSQNKLQDESFIERI